MSKSIGVIVGRFQIDMLHEHHFNLIHQSLDEDNLTLVIIGGSSCKEPTNRNPLSVKQRYEHLKSLFAGKNVVLSIIEDTRFDSDWYDKLEQIIDTHNIFNHKVNLYSGSKGFGPAYNQANRKYTAQIIGNQDSSDTSSTEMRGHIVSTDHEPNNRDYRTGIIRGVGSLRPRIYNTVDIAMIKHDLKGGDIHNRIEAQVLLGRKKNELQWRFPGGFVDFKDYDLEEAARREFHEETGLFIEHPLEYVTSLTVQDWRYENETDAKILTTLFKTDYMSESPKPGDDLEEVAWFNVFESNTLYVLVPEHKILWNKLIVYLNKTL